MIEANKRSLFGFLKCRDIRLITNYVHVFLINCKFMTSNPIKGLSKWKTIPLEFFSINRTVFSRPGYGD